MTRLALLPLLVLLPWAAGCGGRPDAEGGPGHVERRRSAHGLALRVVLHADDPAKGAQAAAAALDDAARLLALLDPADPHSELRRLADEAAGTGVAVSRDLWDALSLALDFARRTRGAYDPTRGPLQETWARAARAGRAPREAEILEARTRVGWDKVQLQPPTRSVRLLAADMRLDLGGLAPAFAAQQAWALLGQRGFPACRVDVGGYVVVGAPEPGHQAWTVRVPGGTALALRGGALAVAGDTATPWTLGGTSHARAVDPRTGLGLTTPLRATVVARDGPSAAAFAAALTVLPEAQGLKQASSTPGVEARLRRPDGSTVQTPGFAALLSPGR